MRNKGRNSDHWTGAQNMGLRMFCKHLALFLSRSLSASLIICVCNACCTVVGCYKQADLSY